MKRLVLLFLVAFAASWASAQTTPSHDKYVYIGSTTEGDAWYKAYQNWTEGSVLYPNDPVAAENENFFISRVKPRERFTFTKTQVKESLNPARKLLWWCPINESGWNAVPSYFFNGEAFSMWSYVDIYGNWTAPMLQAPAAFLDVCHKNGVATGVVCSVPFGAAPSPSDGGHGSTIAALYNGGYDKLLRYLRYYGVDGVGWNSEFSWGNLNMASFRNLMGDCYAHAEEYGVPLFNNAWYSFTSNSGGTGDFSYLDSSCSDWFHYNGKTVSSAYFLNYNWNSTLLSRSQSTANSFQGRSSFDVYAGMDFQGRNEANWLDLQRYNISVGIWGAHNTNMLLIQQGENGSTPLQKQATYQLVSENVFTGSSYNPVNTPAITNLLTHTSKATNFHGFSSFITARSALTCDDLEQDPFVTYFNMGNGQFYNVNGERQFTGDWYNIGMQDYLPTWRWWWTSTYMGKNASDATTDMKAEFNWTDAWFGGSCLQISGATDAAYLQLFKTKYQTARTGDKLTIRYKVLSGNGKMEWACSTEADPLTAVTATISSNATTSGGWIEKTINIGSGRSDLKVHDSTLALIGLKFSNTSSNFKVLIGEISLTRGTSITPSAPEITVSKVLARNYKGVDFKVIYKMPTSKPAPVYNSDVDTWFYKIYIQQAGLEEVMCTATTSWAAYVVGAPYDLEKGGTIKIGVSAVSKDGKSESPIAWSESLTLPDPVIVEGIEIDKTIIKPGETFTAKYADPFHAPAKWEIVNATTGEIVKTENNAVSVTTSLSDIGLYDIKITNNDGTSSSSRGIIQISPEATGAVPTLESFTADKQNVQVGETVNLSYVATRLGEGKVSRAIKVDDPNMVYFPNMIPKRPYTYMMWFKLESISHDTQGTNLINKLNKSCTQWPHNNWGDFWVQIRPNNEISFNVFGWTAHDNPNENMKSTGYTVEVDQWTHIAVTLETDNTEKMYFNGKLVAQTVDGNVSNDGQNTSCGVGDVYIGGSNTYKSGMNGWIDDFQVWDRVLNDREVQQYMMGIEGSAPNGLIGYWDFEELNGAGRFTNKGTLGSNSQWDARYVKFDGGMVDVAANIDQLGIPVLSGSLDVTTRATWSIPGGTLLSTGGSKDNGTAQVSYDASGEYTPSITLENMWGSDTKDIEFITVTDPSGIENIAEAEALGVYPNPFTDYVNILFSQSGDYTIQIVALDGKVIENKTLGVSENEIVRLDVNGGAGQYIVRILNADNIAVRTMTVIKK